MEIGLDFGLFELLAAAGLASAARLVFSRRWMAVAFLVWSVAAPVTLLFLVEGEMLRWLVAACLAPVAVLVATIVLLMRRYDLAELLRRRTAGEAGSRGV